MAVIGTLTLAPGETSKTISIGTLDDSVQERQSAQVTLTNASANARILDGEGFGTVYDDDPSPTYGWSQEAFDTYSYWLWSTVAA